MLSVQLESISSALNDQCVTAERHRPNRRAPCTASSPYVSSQITLSPKAPLQLYDSSHLLLFAKMSNYYDDEDNASHSDGSEDSELTDQEIVKHDLHDHISQIHSAGSFATFGRIEDFSHPGVSVDPIGILRLPLSEDDARALARASHQAPFGYGTQTLVDETVRKTWEIDATKVIFNNQGWKLCLDRVVEEVAEGLGVIGGSTNIRAEFYKMLLYEKGAMFKPHREYIPCSSLVIIG